MGSENVAVEAYHITLWCLYICNCCLGYQQMCSTSRFDSLDIL